MKILKYIIVHCSDSEWGSAREIRKWHLEKGWKDIGYHFVVLNGLILPDFTVACLNGSIELGRELDGDAFVEDNEEGAHALGYNDQSLGICGVAKKEWHPCQVFSLTHLCRELAEQFHIPRENILGHYETASGKAQGKTCPNLDMNWFRNQM